MLEIEPLALHMLIKHPDTGLPLAPCVILHSQKALLCPCFLRALFVALLSLSPAPLAHSRVSLAGPVAAQHAIPQPNGSSNKHLPSQSLCGSGAGE